MFHLNDARMVNKTCDRARDESEQSQRSGFSIWNSTGAELSISRLPTKVSFITTWNCCCYLMVNVRPHPRLDFKFHRIICSSPKMCFFFVFLYFLFFISICYSTLYNKYYIALYRIQLELNRRERESGSTSCLEYLCCPFCTEINSSLCVFVCYFSHENRFLSFYFRYQRFWPGKAVCARTCACVLLWRWHTTPASLSHLKWIWISSQLESVSFIIYCIIHNVHCVHSVPHISNTHRDV